MAKIIVAAVLVLSGIVIMGKARGLGSILGLILFLVGVFAGVALWMSPDS